MPIPQPNLRGLVDNQVGDVITRLVAAVNALESGIARFSTPPTSTSPAAPFSLTPATLRAIRDALQVGGATPLNVTKLLGIESFVDEDLIVTGNWTFAGTVSFTNTVTFSGSVVLSGFTTGSVLFAGASGVISQDNSNLFWDDTNNKLLLGSGSATHPSYSFGSSSNTGFFLIAAGRIQVSISGSARWQIQTTEMGGASSVDPTFRRGTSLTVPGLLPWAADTNTGIGGNGSDVLTLIAGGAARLSALTSGIGIGVGALGASSVNVVGVGIGTAPTTQPADMVQAWVADAAAGDARLYILTEAGATPSVIGNGIIAVGGIGTNLLPAFTFSLDPNTGIYGVAADQLGITAGGTLVADFAAGATNLTGSLQCDSIVNDTGLAHGTTALTDSANSNLDSATPTACQYIRLGERVVVSGLVTVEATAAGATSFELSLPIASDLSAAEQLAGAGVTTAGEAVRILGSVANDTAVFSWVATDTSLQLLSYIFQYNRRP